MYIPVTARWKPYVYDEIERIKAIIYHEKLTRDVPSEYDAQTCIISVDGVNMIVTQELLDLFVHALPKKMCSGRKWRLVVSNVKQAAQLIDGVFDPKYVIKE
jgi:hypothetical protein